MEFGRDFFLDSCNYDGILEPLLVCGHYGKMPVTQKPLIDKSRLD